MSDDPQPTDTEKADTEKAGASLRRLRSVSRTIGFFWRLVTYAGLALMTLTVFASAPRLLLQPRGWLILLLAAAFGVWYWLGMRWVTGCGAQEGAFWGGRLRHLVTAGAGLPYREVAYWGGLLLLALALYALADVYRWLFWPVYGVGLTLLPLTQAVFLALPSLGIIVVVNGWLPRDGSPDALFSFAGTLLVLIIYSATACTPFFVLRGRFEREHIFAELERSHSELAEAHRRLAASSAQERELAVLRERERLARELHDTLGHALTLISVKLEAAQRLRGRDAARADAEVRATQALARETMAELRASLAYLRSPAPAPEPLAEALTRRAREAATRAGWTLTCKFAPELGPLAPPVAETLLRVGCEALTNAERHARARQVALRLAREGDGVNLRIQDDGAGFHPLHAGAEAPAPVGAPAVEKGPEDRDATLDPTLPPVSPPGHYGVTGMRERVEAMGGRFTLTSAPGAGVTVEAWLPAH